MLRVGQKVQYSHKTRVYYQDKNYESDIAGKIAYVIEFLGERPCKKNGELHSYYRTNISSRPASRCILFPIDDQPADKDFMEWLENEKPKCISIKC